MTSEPLPDLARLLEDLDRASPLAPICADAARLLRAMAEDFAEYAQHMLPSPRLPPGCLTREMHPPSATFHFACDCGVEKARQRWRLP